MFDWFDNVSSTLICNLCPFFSYTIMFKLKNWNAKALCAHFHPNEILQLPFNTSLPHDAMCFCCCCCWFFFRGIIITIFITSRLLFNAYFQLLFAFNAPSIFLIYQHQRLRQSFVRFLFFFEQFKLSLWPTECPRSNRYNQFECIHTHLKNFMHFCAN